MLSRAAGVVVVALVPTAFLLLRSQAYRTDPYLQPCRDLTRARFDQLSYQMRLSTLISLRLLIPGKRLVISRMT